MEDIREVALAYYKGAEEAERKLFDDFFRSLDENGDNRVSRSEFRKKLGVYAYDTSFRDMDTDRSGYLDKTEVLAYYYLGKVSVPRCSCCKNRLVASYFSCLTCQAEGSFYLCCKCYSSRKYLNHRHGKNNFIDSRSILKMFDKIMKESKNSDMLTLQVTDAAVGQQSTPPPPTTTSKWDPKTFVEAMNSAAAVGKVGLQIGQAAYSVGCNIM